MSEQNTHKQVNFKSTGYELFILQLSVLSLINLLFITIPGTKPVFKDVLKTMDFIISIIFLGDFLYRLLTAESKRDYFFKHYGWADFLASMPFEQLKVLRIFRIVRVFRLLRLIGVRNLWKEAKRSRAESTLQVTVFLVIVVLEFSSLMIIAIESSLPGANIKTAADAIWWGYVTITTVGYGDLYPVTTAGRTVGLFLLTAGIGLFGVLTGYLANAFLAPENSSEPEKVPEHEEYEEKTRARSEVHIIPKGDAQAMLTELAALVNEQAEANERVKQRLAVLERSLAENQ